MNGETSANTPSHGFAHRGVRALRRGVRSGRPLRVSGFDFTTLVRREEAQIEGKCCDTRTSVEVEGTDLDEPWVSRRQRDRFGLALSGGGIRSATFNLGLLEALARPLGPSGGSILAEVDYLSTVSGGGYVGGFWTRWRHSRSLGPPAAVVSPDAAAVFPQPRRSAAGLLEPEPREVRHMRERSRFLMPRVGIFHADTWAGLVAVLGGLLPSLGFACALIGLAWHVWLALVQALYSHPVLAPALLAALTYWLQMLTESNWRRHKLGLRPSWAYWLFALPVAGAVYGVWYVLLLVLPGSAAIASRGPLELQWLFALDGSSRLVLAPAVPWLATGLLLLAIRALLSRGMSAVAVAAFERAASRCFVPALVWLLLCGLWLGAQMAKQHALLASVGTSATAGGLFVWLREWLTEPLRETRGGRLLDRMMGALKPVLPQVLAYVAVLGLVCGIALVLVALGRIAPLVQPTDVRIFPLDAIPLALLTAVSCLAMVVCCIVFLDPDRIGLHEFYRSRIEGTFLGAACDDSAPLNVADGDRDADLDVRELRGQRPIHLVCCTANNLSGDPLPNLYRGGRSAVVSPNGVALGDSVADYRDLCLSSALTASAAAFNSQMGGFSIRLGPAVGFLMTALGLRLGMWLQHPDDNAAKRSLPGWDLLREMFGLTRSTHARKAKASGSRAAEQRVEDVHLSDGGHFENLGLYELVRRRCRYIVVSDCGADAELAFDDLANAIRLVREDFGVEIEIDVSPLRPGSDGLSQQHAVVGTLHYDGAHGSDKGILMYLKPTLVGDEPPDVAQYRTRNPAFPHEGTTDQFYDESQWESYRRLGLHCGGMVFGFASENGFDGRAKPVEWVFLESLERWQPVRDTDPKALQGLLRDRDRLLAEIRKAAPASFRAQLFPEAAHAMKHDIARLGSPDDELQTLLLCAELAGLMERVWVAARLEAHWTHPRNRRWMSFFERVAATASFRRWWMLLRPSFRDGFCDFVKLRLGVRMRSQRTSDPRDAPVGLLLETASAVSLHSTELYRRWRRWDGGRDITPGSERRFLAYRAVWADRDLSDVTVGLVAYECDKDHRRARWHSCDLFVPAALTGAGIASRLLDATLEELAKLGAREAEVVLEADRARPTASVLADPAHRQQRLHDLHFYKSRDFEQHAPGILRRTLSRPVTSHG